MEGHAEMDMAVTEGGTLWQRMASAEGLTAISHYFVMDWASVWLDIVGGLLIAGALAAWVPHNFWQSFFLVDHPLLASLWGRSVGPSGRGVHLEARAHRSLAPFLVQRGGARLFHGYVEPCVCGERRHEGYGRDWTGDELARELRSGAGQSSSFVQMRP